MERKKIKRKMLSLLLAFALFAGTFGVLPAKEVEAATMPIGIGAALPLGTIITLPDGSDKYQNIYYTMTIPSTGTLTINNISNADAVEIRNADDNEILLDDWGVSIINTIFIRGGRYSVRLGSNRKDSKISFTFLSSNESFPESETNNNDTDATPTKISSLSGALWTGVLACYDKDDWYSFTLQKNSVLDYIVTKKTADMGLGYKLMKADGNIIDYDDRCDSRNKHSIILPAGKYYLRIYREISSMGVYNFYLKATPIKTVAKKLITKAPSVKVSKKGKMTISWNKAPGSMGYQIQVSNKKSFSTKTTYNVANVNKKAVSVKKAWRGKTVFVRVKTYYKTPNGQKLYSDWSKVKAVKTKK